MLAVSVGNAQSSMCWNIGFFNIEFSDLWLGRALGEGDVWADPDQYRQIGAILTAERKRLGITQVDLAGRLGKPQSFVSSYESGQRRLDLVEFLRVAHALNLDPQMLFRVIVGGIQDP